VPYPAPHCWRTLFAFGAGTPARPTCLLVLPHTTFFVGSLWLLPVWVLRQLPVWFYAVTRHASVSASTPASPDRILAANFYTTTPDIALSHAAVLYSDRLLADMPTQHARTPTPCRVYANTLLTLYPGGTLPRTTRTTYAAVVLPPAAFYLPYCRATCYPATFILVVPLWVYQYGGDRMMRKLYLRRSRRCMRYVAGKERFTCKTYATYLPHTSKHDIARGAPRSRIARRGAQKHNRLFRMTPYFTVGYLRAYLQRWRRRDDA